MTFYRFVNQSDVEWFEKHLHNTVTEELGDDYEQILLAEPLFVSFMKDPEDMVEQGRMNDDDEIPDFPNVYESVSR